MIAASPKSLTFSITIKSYKTGKDGNILAFKVPAHLPKFNCYSLVHWLAVGFGSGLSPKAPGTFGTLTAIPLYILAQHFSLFSYTITTLLGLLLGIWICDKTAKDFQVHDHPSIVWDEIIGYFITMFYAPVGWQWIIIGFILFRLFDIAKPWPISWFDKHVHGGLGIMLDDVIAGIFALISLQWLAWMSIMV